MRSYLLLLLFSLGFTVHSLEIWQNNQLIHLWNRDELEANAIPLEDHLILPLNDVIPFYSEIHELEIFSDQGEFTIMDPELIQKVNLILKDEDVVLSAGPHIFSNPRGINVIGMPSERSSLTLWMDSEDAFLQPSLKLFAQIHKLELAIEISEDLPSRVSDALISNNMTADLILYSHKDFPFMAPYIHSFPLESPFLPNAELWNRISGKAYPLYFRVKSWHSSDLHAERLADSVMNISALDPSELSRVLNKLATEGELPHLDLYEPQLTLVSIPLSKDADPAIRSLIDFLNNPYRLEGILSQQEDLFPISQMGSIDGLGSLNMNNWRRMYIKDRLIHLLPLLRSGLISVEVVEEDLNEVLDFAERK